MRLLKERFFFPGFSVNFFFFNFVVLNGKWLDNNKKPCFCCSANWVPNSLKTIRI